jgi:hypothetical protein
MQSQSKRWVIGASLATLLLLALCDTALAKPPGRGPRFQPGPPAHAPAHGVRRKQVHGFQLTFDVGLGVYVAVGVTDVYYHGGYFYRVRGSVWEISLRGDVWGPVVIEKLPPGLQVKAKSMVKLNGNGNSLVKLNGNAGGNDNKGNTGSAGKGGQPANGATGNANQPASGGGKPNAAASSSINKPNAEGGKPSGKSDAGASQPNGSAGGNDKQVSDKPAGSGAQSSKPASGGKAGSGPKGKKK